MGNTHTMGHTRTFPDKRNSPITLGPGGPTHGLATEASSVQALEPLQKRALEQLAEDLEERTPHGAWHVRICRAAETAELLSPTHPSSDRENAGVPRGRGPDSGGAQL